MSSRIFNFSAGPAMLPTEVMERAQKEFCNYNGVGNGILELSHRGKEFMEVMDRAEANIRSIMNISEDYAVLFLQGGASMQFSMLPMNLMKKGGFAEYADTGMWSTKAIKEAKLFGEVKIIASSKDSKYDRVPTIRHWQPEEDSSYIHITSNNTIYGTQYHDTPEVKAPLVADMSSDIMSRIIDVNKYGMIYAGAQKNLGPSGVTLVIIKKDLLEKSPKDLPSMFNYNTYYSKGSMFNTPPTFSIYMLSLVSDWIIEKGGLKVVEEINDMKSEVLYETIDTSGFYSSPVDPASRSRMNIVMNLPTPELEAKFIKEAGIEGMIGLKGHRAVGGIRASIYNSMPMRGVEQLIDFMTEFEKING